MKVKYEFCIREIAGDYILVPLGEAALAFSGMVTTNEVGILIWKELQNGTTREQLITAVLNEFEIDEKTAASDVDEFLKQLEQLDLLQK